MLKIKAPCDLISQKSVIRSYVTQTANEFLNDPIESDEKVKTKDLSRINGGFCLRKKL